MPPPPSRMSFKLPPQARQDFIKKESANLIEIKRSILHTSVGPSTLPVEEEGGTDLRFCVFILLNMLVPLLLSSSLACLVVSISLASRDTQRSRWCAVSALLLSICCGAGGLQQHVVRRRACSNSASSMSAASISAQKTDQTLCNVILPLVFTSLVHVSVYEGDDSDVGKLPAYSWAGLGLGELAALLLLLHLACTGPCHTPGMGAVAVHCLSLLFQVASILLIVYPVFSKDGASTERDLFTLISGISWALRCLSHLFETFMMSRTCSESFTGGHVASYSIELLVRPGLTLLVLTCVLDS